MLNSYTAKRIFLAYSSINVHTYIDSPQSESGSFITSIKFLVLPTVVTLYPQPENLALLSSSSLPWFPLLRLLYKWNDPVCNLLRVLASHSILLWDSSKLRVITIGPSLWSWVVFHCMDIPLCLPITHWWIFGLFPVSGCYEYSCCKHSCMSFHVDVKFSFLGGKCPGVDCWAVFKVYI